MNDHYHLQTSRSSRIDSFVSDLVEEGIVTTTLGDLRERIVNVGRLGVNVLARIEQDLKANGIGFFPEDSFRKQAPRQQHEVRLYLRASTVGRVIDAVLEPSSVGDSILKELSTSSSDSATAGDLETIRDAVANIVAAEALLRDYLNEDTLNKGGM